MTYAAGTFLARRAYRIVEDDMKAYLANLPAKTWALVVIPAILAAYPILRALAPAMMHALVPEVVRSLLRVI